MLESLVLSAALHGARVGIEAVDVRTGAVVLARDPDGAYTPASVMKLLVGSAALSVLGPNFRYTTTVATDAAGNVYLRGGGDALLSPQDLHDAASALALAGVGRVVDVVADTSHFGGPRYGAGWAIDDIPYYYQPPVSALEVNDGVLDVRALAGAAPGDPVRITVQPPESGVTIENEMTTGARGSADTTDIVRPWNAPQTIELTGSYPLGAPESGDFAPSLPDPPMTAATLFANDQRGFGITVDGSLRMGTMPQRVEVRWSHESLALPQLLARMWQPSDDLMAESLLRELGVARGGEPGTVANGIASEDAFLRQIGVDPTTLSINDGSGLSTYDRLTPRAVVTLLRSDWNGPYRALVQNALPVAGVRGTLAQAFVGTPLAGRVYAKTGTLTHTHTLAGYLFTHAHGTIAFAIFVNDDITDDTARGADAARALDEQILEELDGGRCMEPTAGLEPATCCLRNSCSTN